MVTGAGIVPSREIAASTPNFAASASIWNVTARGVSSSTGFPVWAWTLAAQTSSCADLPSPQSSNSAPRPCRIAHAVISAWNGNRNPGSHVGSNPDWAPSWVLAARYAAHVSCCMMSLHITGFLLVGSAALPAVRVAAGGGGAGGVSDVVFGGVEFAGPPVLGGPAAGGALADAVGGGDVGHGQVTAARHQRRLPVSCWASASRSPATVHAEMQMPPADAWYTFAPGPAVEPM